MAGSGHKKVILNTREKWISPDFNRMQSFVAAHNADIIRFMLNVRTGNDEFAGTLIANPSDAIGDPPIADIFEGLTVLPQAGKTSLHIIGGVIGMVDPDKRDVDPDDSVYKLTVDPGFQTDGQLDISANVSGSIRIDVIECARTTLILATDNRDIFNPATGLFSPVNVDKVEAGRLMFRVREGTPGAGFPGTAPGWVPLCVASVPNGSINTDDVTFWDVRPLIHDRTNAPHTTTLGFPRSFDELNFHTERDATNGSETRLMGHIWGHLSGRKIGGRISKGTPGGDVLYVDLQDSDNQEPGFALATAGELYYVWAVFPEGLPRWVRYAETAVAGQRIPSGFRGILIASNTGPEEADMTPSSPLTLPTITGLISTVAVQARCVAAGKADIINDPGTLTAPGDGWMYFEPNALGAGKVPDTITGSIDDYTLVAGVDFPANARAVKVRIDFNITTSGAGESFGYFNTITVADSAGASSVRSIAEGAELLYVTTTVALESISQVFEVPRLPPWADPTAFIPSDIKIRHLHSVFGSFISKDAELIRVIGWRIE